MYILNDFYKALRLFVQTHAELDIDIKLPMLKHHINGHIRFYSTKVSGIKHINPPKVLNFVSILNLINYLLFSRTYKTLLKS